MSQLFDLLKGRITQPLNLVDVGAAGGAIEGWNEFGDKAHVYCFEARDDEAQELSSSNKNSNIEYVPYALSTDGSGISLTITAIPTCSSSYKPIRSIYEKYPGCAIMRPVEEVKCRSVSIDKFMNSRDIDRIHAIKLDTQGAELDILKGAKKALASCLFVIVEVEFNSLYEGQPLFCDVDRFMRDHGFVLWRLNNLAHYSTGVINQEPHAMMIGSDPGGHQMVHFANGQLFWGDALYVKSSATSATEESLSYDDAVAGAALVAQWRFWDLALEMVRKSGDHGLLSEVRSILGADYIEYHPDVIDAAKFSTDMPSTPEGVRRIFPLTEVAEGSCITYGPYIRLPEGEFEVVFDVRADGSNAEGFPALLFDVAQDQVRQASISVNGSSDAAFIRDNGIRIRFKNYSPQSRFEFRIYNAGKNSPNDLVFSGVRLINLRDDSSRSNDLANRKVETSLEEEANS